MFKRNKYFNNESGQAMVVAAIAMVVLIGFAGFAIDLGSMAHEKSKLQNAADSAALAGAQELPNYSSAEAVAKSYGEYNGVTDTEINADSPYIDSEKVSHPDQVSVVCTRNVSYTFLKVFGLSNKEVSVHAVAQRVPGNFADPVFGYAVFAGDSLLKWNGGNFIIGGDIYGDKGIKLTGNGSDIAGDVVYNTGSVNIGGTYDGSKIQKKETMPDFAGTVTAQAIASGTYFANQAAFDVRYYDQPGKPGSPEIPAVYKKGKLVTATVPAIAATPATVGEAINGPVWVDGDLDISKPLKGNGIIYASGDYAYSYNDASTGSMASICFYASGDITFNGGSGKISGILYAPNGTVTINGTPKENKIWGRMISKDVTVNGNGYTVIARDSDLDWLNTFAGTPKYKLVE